jgi:hypothetical protein
LINKRKWEIFFIIYRKAFREEYEGREEKWKRG